MEERRFAYHRAVAPMLWVLVGLSSIELVVVHLLLAFWSRTAALSLSAATLAAMLWLVHAIRSMKRRPVLLDGARLLMRVGTLKRVSIPVAAIAGLREGWDRAALKAPGVVNLALVAWPNVMVELREPVAGRRGPVTAVAHRLDDPAAFAAAIRALTGRA